MHESCRHLAEAYGHSYPRKLYQIALVYSVAKDYVAVRRTLSTRQSVQPANNSTMDPQHALYPTD